MKKLILIGLVMVACFVLAVAVWHKWNGRNNNGGHVFVSGNIEATEVDLSFRIAGQIKTRPVDEGDRVAEGQVVATLDTDTLEALKGAAAAELNAAQANLDQLEEGYRKEEIDMARAQLKGAESKLKNAKDEYERYLPLYKEGAISPSTLDLREMALKVATEEYNNARHALLKLETGPREQEIRAARSRLEKGKWDLQRIELDLDHSLLKSPITGVVLVKAGEVGEVVLPGATVLTVAAIDEVWLRGYVSEQDLGKIKLGQTAHITTDSFPTKIYEGSVTYISPRAEFTPKNVQTKEERVKQVYRVKITIPNQHQELKIGMPAEGYILTEESPTTAQNKGQPSSKQP